VLIASSYCRERWFSVGLLQTTLLYATGYLFGNKETQQLLCKAAAVNWFFWMRKTRNEPLVDDTSDIVNRAYITTLGVVALVGGGVLR